MKRHAQLSKKLKARPGMRAEVDRPKRGDFALPVAQFHAEAA